jgi:hypothetical protein
MTTLQVLVPDDVQEKAAEVAKQRHLSLDELTTIALIEKLSMVVADPYLEARARLADGTGFAEFMAQVPKVPPEDYDRLQ